MTPEEQRIAIALSVGWTQVDQLRWSDDKLDPPKQFMAGCGHLPDFLNDLNAMNAAEKAMAFHEQYKYGDRLRVMTDNVGPKGGHITLNGFGCFALATATAAQRAEAYLRAKGLWKD